MPDLPLLLAPLMFAYVSVALGIVAALLLRAWLRRNTPLLSVTQAAWCVWLPVLALVTLMVASVLPSAAQEPEHALHQTWHTWATALTLSPGLHQALHTLNTFLLVYAMGAVVWMAFTVGRLRALTVTLRKIPARQQHWNGQPLVTLDTPQPVCFTIGLWHPRIYVSSSLLEQLTPRHRDAMFAHETAHLRRRDGLMGAALMVFYSLFPLPGTRVLMREWQYAAERACDEAAARQVGDPCDVAEALVEVTRLVSHPAVSGVTCFAASGDMEERVASLLTLGQGSKRFKHEVLFLFSIVLCLAGFLAAEMWIRHLVELFVHH